MKKILLTSMVAAGLAGVMFISASHAKPNEEIQFLVCRNAIFNMDAFLMWENTGGGVYREPMHHFVPEQPCYAASITELPFVDGLLKDQ